MAVVVKTESIESEKTGKGKRIYEALKSGAKTIEEIARATNLSVRSIEEYIGDHEDEFVKKRKNHQDTYRFKKK